MLSDIVFNNSRIRRSYQTMDMDLDAIFQNSVMIHRLEVFVNEAIRLNEPLFVEQIGCTIREYRVLKIVDEYGGISFKEITRVTGLERSLVSRQIRALVNRELIYRVNSKQDARRFGLFTTETGKTACDTGRQLSSEAEKHLFKALQIGEVEQLNTLVHKLSAWVRDPSYSEQIQKTQSEQN